MRTPLALLFISLGVVAAVWWWLATPVTLARAPIDAVRMSRKKMFVSLDKAKRELGFNPGPVDGALKRAVDWFRANGYV